MTDNTFFARLASIVIFFLLGSVGVFAFDFALTQMDLERCMKLQRAIDNGHPITLPDYCHE